MLCWRYFWRWSGQKCLKVFCKFVSTSVSWNSFKFCRGRLPHSRLKTCIIHIQRYKSISLFILRLFFLDILLKRFRMYSMLCWRDFWRWYCQKCLKVLCKCVPKIFCKFVPSSASWNSIQFCRGRLSHSRLNTCIVHIQR